jgi:hypothetical protein
MNGRTGRRPVHAAPAIQPPHSSERWVCRKCAGVSGAHYLTCPALRLPPDVPPYSDGGDR